MNLCLLALCLSVSAGPAPSTPGPALAQELSHWAGGNIGRFPQAERAKFLAFVDFLAQPDKPKKYIFYADSDPDTVFEGGGDAYVWPFRGSVSPRYLVYLNPHHSSNPGAEEAFLFFVDEKGKVIEKYDFCTGNRDMLANGASYGMVSWLSTPVLIQEMKKVLINDGPRRIYLAFDGMRPAVVRIEDADHNAESMDYFLPGWDVGPHYQAQSLVQLVQALQGSNEIERLQALIWLSGGHARVSDNKPGESHEELSQQKIYAAAINSPQVSEIVKTLRSSPNPNVRDLADRVPLGVGDFDHWPYTGQPKESDFKHR